MEKSIFELTDIIKKVWKLFLSLVFFHSSILFPSTELTENNTQKSTQVDSQPNSTPSSEPMVKIYPAMTQITICTPTSSEAPSSNPQLYVFSTILTACELYFWFFSLLVNDILDWIAKVNFTLYLARLVITNFTSN